MDQEYSSLKRYNRNCFEDFEELVWPNVGSFGQFKTLYHKDFNRFVTVKFSAKNKYWFKNEKHPDDVKKEAKILAQFEHKNIIRVIGIASWSDRNTGVILECISCGNLQDLLMRELDTPLPWQIRARFFVEIASGLDYLHKNSFVHGDLKPQNVLLSNNLEVKLAEFGTAKCILHSQDFDSKKPKENQKSDLCPEIYSKNPNEYGVDVYNYGMIGYEILTRRKMLSESYFSYNFARFFPFIGTLISFLYPLYSVVQQFIAKRGQNQKKIFQKPPQNNLIDDDVARELIMGEDSDLEIFNRLREIVYNCWENDVANRPKMSEVKKRLDELAQSQKIYDKATNAEAKTLVTTRNLETPKHRNF